MREKYIAISQNILPYSKHLHFNRLTPLFAVPNFAALYHREVSKYRRLSPLLTERLAVLLYNSTEGEEYSPI